VESALPGGGKEIKECFVWLGGGSTADIGNALKRVIAGGYGGDIWARSRTCLLRCFPKQGCLEHNPNKLSTRTSFINVDIRINEDISHLPSQSDSRCLPAGVVSMPLQNLTSLQTLRPSLL
jgi:hypothetical protein